MILNNVDNGADSIDGLFDIVHEVKNSIAVCRGYLDIIDSNKGEDVNRYLSILRKEINRSTDIIGDFMLCRRINIVKEIMDINFLLVDLCEEMDLFIENKGIDFEYEISDDEIYIEGDYAKLRQVFINLIKNGIESIEGDGGKIKVVSYVKGSNYYVQINDNGSGMSKETLKKIKEGGVTTKENGNGIGVRFSNQIIQVHNGSVNYYSKVGDGTKVIVKLPIIMI